MLWSRVKHVSVPLRVCVHIRIEGQGKIRKAMGCLVDKDLMHLLEIIGPCFEPIPEHERSGRGLLRKRAKLRRYESLSR
jgi:hypothetical protein